MKFLLLLPLSLLTLVGARAQSVIVAKEGFDTNSVVAVKSDDTPIVVVKGKARAAVAKAKLTIKPGATYHDAFFNVRPFKIQDAAEAGQVLITGTVVPDRAISRSFVAVEVKGMDRSTKYVRVTALPDNLSPTTPGSFAIQVEGKAAKKSKVRPVVHFFVGTMEAINSGMSADEIAKAKAKRDEYTLAHTPERDVAPIYAVAPGYPAALRDSGQAGSAKIFCHIDREGQATEVKVQEASAPEFGEAAAAAIKEWLFAPAIKDGQFVETDAVIPINFAPVTK